MKLLTLIRGLPGSGKSTLAAKIDPNFVEADQYHVTDGVYKFDPAKKGAAHMWCMKTTAMRMRKGDEQVCVSNTFVRHADMENYLGMAQTFGYQVQIISCYAQFRSIHNVPQEIIDKMEASWED